MARAVRLLILLAVLTPAPVVVGCNPNADSTPNTALGPPPNIPPGRGAEGRGPGGAMDPNATKKPKK